MRTIIASLLLSLVSVFAVAMNSSEEGQIVSRVKELRQAKVGVTKQSGEVKRLLLGHTVTDCGETILTLQAIQNDHMDSRGWSDIGYNFICDRKGDAYKCRELDEAPSMLLGHNVGSCGIGFIGAYHENVVTEEMAIKWGKILRKIANLHGLGKLERDQNVVTQSGLAHDRFPDSPGKYFLAQLDLMIQTANEGL